MAVPSGNDFLTYNSQNTLTGLVKDPEFNKYVKSYYGDDIYELYDGTDGEHADNRDIVDYRAIGVNGFGDSYNGGINVRSITLPNATTIYSSAFINCA